MDNTEGASNESEKPKVEEYFVQKVPGLYVAENPDNERGQTSVVRHDPSDNRMYPVWDSTWKQSQDTPDLPQDLFQLTLNRGQNILTVPAKLEQMLSVHHAPLKGRQTTIFIQPSNKIEALIPRYMRTLSAAQVSKEELAKPIPPLDPSPGQKKHVFGKLIAKQIAAMESDPDYEEPGVEDEDHASAAAPVAWSGAFGKLPFLHVYEHHTCNGTLILDSQSGSLRLTSRSKSNAEDLLFNLEAEDVNKPVHIEYYRFKQGYTLRLNNCGPTTEKKTRLPPSDTKEKPKYTKKTLHYKELHVYHPDDRWNTGFHHETWTDDYKDGYGAYDEVQAKHNVLAFPRFMDELERILKEGSEKGRAKEGGRGRGKAKKRDGSKANGKAKATTKGEEERVHVQKCRKDGDDLVPDIWTRTTQEERDQIIKQRADHAAEEEEEEEEEEEDSMPKDDDDDEITLEDADPMDL